MYCREGPVGAHNIWTVFETTQDFYWKDMPHQKCLP